MAGSDSKRYSAERAKVTTGNFLGIGNPLKSGIRKRDRLGSIAYTTDDEDESVVSKVFGAASSARKQDTSK